MLGHWPRGRDTGRRHRTLFWYLRATDRLTAFSPGGYGRRDHSGGVGHIGAGPLLGFAWGRSQPGHRDVGHVPDIPHCGRRALPRQRDQHRFCVASGNGTAYFDMLETHFGGDRMPPQLAAGSVVMFDPERGVPQILGSWAYFGPEDEARSVIAPLLELEPPVLVVQSVPTNKLLHTAGFGFIPVIQRDSAIRSAYSANMKTISGSALLNAFEKMCSLYETHPDARGSAIEMEHFPNQAMAAVLDEDTAYPWRDARSNMYANNALIILDPRLTICV